MVQVMVALRIVSLQRFLLVRPLDGHPTISDIKTFLRLRSNFTPLFFLTYISSTTCSSTLRALRRSARLWTQGMNAFSGEVYEEEDRVFMTTR